MTIRSLLGPSDLTYLGYYVVPGSTAGYGSGFSFRYVGGVFRGQSLFYTSAFWLQEYTLPSAFGQNVAVRGRTGGQGDVFNGASYNSGTHVGIWSEDMGGGAVRMWTNQATDYPSDANTNRTSCVATVGIAANDVISGWQGWWGLQNVGQRAHYGGVRGVPAWFQSAHGVGPYLTGFGGYSSRMNTGLQPSLGPFVAFIADPHGYPTEDIGVTNGGTVPYKLSADYRSGASHGSDWFPNYAARTWDRGPRVSTDTTNWFDGNDNRTNPSSRPTYPGNLSAATHWWTGPSGGAAPGDPNGFGRWTWGDTCGGLAWIDNNAGTRSKQGIVTVNNLNQGYCWYEGSNLWADAIEYEVQVYDPEDLAAAAAGSIPGYAVRPKSAWTVPLPGMSDSYSPMGAYVTHAVKGVAFDPATNRLYVAGYNQAAGWMRLYVFQVA